MTAVSAPGFDESVAEQALLEWLGELGWPVVHGPELVPHERPDYRQRSCSGACVRRSSG